MNNIENIDIGKLIEEIGPLNNQVRNSDGYEKISLMWDVGDILFKNGVKKIHPIAWEIQKKSYITRDLLSYCYRIRNKWPTKFELEKVLSGIKSYSTFRAALPLIENERYILKEKDVEEIIRALKEGDPIEVKIKIEALKKKYINIRNDRRQRLNELKTQADTFNNFHKYLIALLTKENTKNLDEIRERLGNDALLQLSQMCMAIANDNYKGPSHIDIEESNVVFYTLKENLLPVSLSKKEVKARFRRLVPTEALIEGSDILNSIRNGESLSNIKKRLKLETER
jgi:hypothetical protein